MSKRDRIDEILRSWPYDPTKLSVRLLTSRDRDVIQMRVDLGVLQLETTGRPDGLRPHGDATYYDHLVGRLLQEGGEFRFDEESCSEVDREFIQFYHRRICWLKLQNYRAAMADADHTLRLMDLCRDHSPNSMWTATHEQYRPFVMFHRIQAATLAELEDFGAEAAVSALDDGAQQLAEVFAARGEEDQEEEQELRERLDELRASLVDQFDTRHRLRLKLERAIAAERYEEAAQIRDELAQMDA